MNLLSKAVLALAAAGSAFAQTAPPPTYALTLYMKVPDAGRSAYETYQRETARKVIEARLKEDPDTMMVVLTASLFGNFGGENEPNYFLTAFTRGIPKNNSAADERAAKAAIGKSYREFLNDLAPLRKRVGGTLARQWTGTPTAVEEGDLVRIDRRKVNTGRMGDYIELEQQYLPLREAQVKSGKMKAWSMWTLVMPGGTDRPFDAYTAHVVKDLEGALTWGAGQTAINAELARPVNLTGLAMRGTDLSKIVDSNVRRVVMVVRPK